MKKLLLVLSCLGLYQSHISSSFATSFYVKSVAAPTVTGLAYKAYQRLCTDGLEFTEPSAEQKLVFESLKQEMNITEQVNFKLYVDKYKKWTGARAMHNNIKDLIVLRHDAPNDIFTIFALAHELEHHRQKYKYAGSYHGKDEALKEYGADEAAIKLITCPDCVEKVKKSRYNCDHNKCNSDFVSQGYWGPEEFNQYRDWLIAQGFRTNSGTIRNCEMIFAQ